MDINNKDNQYKEIINYSFLNYLGVIIGILSNIFIYPYNKELLGIIRYIESLAYIILPIIIMGGASCLVNFSPKFKDNSKLLNYIIYVILRNSLITFFVTFLIHDHISHFIKIDYIFISIFLAIILSFVDVFKIRLSLEKKIYIPSFLQNIFPKIFLPLIFIAFYYNLINTEEGVYLHLFSYAFISLFIFGYSFKVKKMNISFNFYSLFNIISKKEYFSYSLYAVAGSLGYLFVYKLDALMIPNLISYEANGVYSIATIAAGVIYIPARGIILIFAPEISELLKKGKIQNVNFIYKNTAKTLVFIGLLIFGILLVGIQDFFTLLPTSNELNQTISVIYIIGTTTLINMAAGLNSQIIIYSKFYKFNISALLFLAFFNVINNYLFIAVFNFGIEGAALASLMSILLYNLIKIIFIYKKLNLIPFDSSYFKLLLIQISIIVIFFFAPNFENIFVNLIIKIALLVSTQLIIIYKLGLVNDYNDFMRRFKSNS